MDGQIPFIILKWTPQIRVNTSSEKWEAQQSPLLTLCVMQRCEYNTTDFARDQDGSTASTFFLLVLTRELEVDALPGDCLRSASAKRRLGVDPEILLLFPFLHRAFLCISASDVMRTTSDIKTCSILSSQYPI